MNKLIIILACSLTIAVLYFFYPTDNNTQQNSHSTDTHHPNTKAEDKTEIHKNEIRRESELDKKNTVQTVQAETLNRGEKIEALRSFFSAQPTDDRQIIDHLQRAAIIKPVEITLEILPYLYSKNEQVQQASLTALNNAMAPTDSEIENPDFIDHQKHAFREHIGTEINNFIKSNHNKNLEQKVIAIYSKTNPSEEDTQRMIGYIYQKNKYSQPTSNEIAYFNESFTRYPDLASSQLKSSEYTHINNALHPPH